MSFETSKDFENQAISKRISGLFISVRPSFTMFVNLSPVGQAVENQLKRGM